MDGICHLYTYQTDNQLLKDEIEKYIDLIGRAQQPDGYLSTKQIIGEETAFPEWVILTISRYTTSDICLQRPVYIYR